VLFGANPEAEQLDDAARDRYLRLAALVAEERNLNASEVEEILSDTQEGVSETASVFNANTRYSVVFEPKARRMRVGVPTPEHRPGAFVTFTFEAEDKSTAAEKGSEKGGAAKS